MIPTIFIGAPKPTDAQYKAIAEFQAANNIVLTGQKGFYSNGVCAFYFFWDFAPENIVSIRYNSDGTLYI